MASACSQDFPPDLDWPRKKLILQLEPILGLAPSDHVIDRGDRQFIMCKMPVNHDIPASIRAKLSSGTQPSPV